ncbi:hypothetical protein [Segatella maculosa]|nr:hypothetical protein [Segatella maculosa]
MGDKGFFNNHLFSSMEDIKKRNKEHSSGAFQIEVQNLGGV